MFCIKCGSQLMEGALFCTQCGAKLNNEKTKENLIDESNIHNEMMTDVPDNSAVYETRKILNSESSEIECFEEKSSEAETSARKETAESEDWWDSCSGIKKIFIILSAVLIVIVLIVFREFWLGLLGLLAIIAFIIGAIITLTTGSTEEKIETRKTLVKIVAGVVIFIIVFFIVVNKPDFFSNIMQPGASVRNAYLSQYSEKVTIENAFDNFFENGKWSTYKKEGYSYVLFTGTCEYYGKKADARISFKITGENFIVDSLDINGQAQNDLMLYSLLSTVYKDY